MAQPPGRRQARPQRTAAPRAGWATTLGIAAAIGLLAALPYLHGINNEFIGLDDPEYVVHNAHIARGLTVEGLRWAVTSFYEGNWDPLTWISHMVDISLFGLDPRGHHAVNIALHALNASLLLLALLRLTGSLWPSAFVAALFGVHPLHVESVAWVAERKDLLAALFFMLLLVAYARYVRRRGAARIFVVTLLLALGLMAKPMLVTVPFVLLLLDVWPLGRTRLAPPASGVEEMTAPWGRLIAEKIPLLALSAASAVVTVFAQQHGGAISTMTTISPGVRATNALVSYAIYLVKTAWPSDLAVLYPHPLRHPHAGQLVAATLLLGAISWAAWALRRRATFLAVGWLWYVGMLVPVIGLVQVGSHARADRFTYLPLIGVFLAATWGTSQALSSWRRGRALLASAAALLLALLAAASWVQVGYWKDSPTLFTRTLALTADNWIIRANLGRDLVARGRLDEAIEHYREALRLRPDHADAHSNLGYALQARGRTAEAYAHLQEALQLQADLPEAHNNMGIILRSQGRILDAIGEYREALRFRPDFPEAHNNLGYALAYLGRHAEAVAEYREALRLRPGFPEARQNLDRALARMGEVAPARR